MGQALSRTGEVMAAIRARIDGRPLARGDRLPSIRALAANLKASPSTIVEAYDRLAAEGVVVSRPGSGLLLSRPGPSRRPSTIWRRVPIAPSTRCGCRGSRSTPPRRR
ncbi:GntR family transcriptional regulator [Caulobacter segnis]